MKVVVQEFTDGKLRIDLVQNWLNMNPRPQILENPVTIEFNAAGEVLVTDIRRSSDILKYSCVLVRPVFVLRI